MSLISDLYPEDQGQSVLQVAACEGYSPKRVARSWVRHQTEAAIGALSENWDDKQLEAVVSMFKAHGLL